MIVSFLLSQTFVPVMANWLMKSHPKQKHGKYYFQGQPIYLIQAKNSLASKKLILQNNDIIILQTMKETKVSEKLQNFNSIMQPILVVVNLAIYAYHVVFLI